MIEFPLGSICFVSCTEYDQNLIKKPIYTQQLLAEYLGKEIYNKTSYCFLVWRLEGHGDNVESC